MIGNRLKDVRSELRLNEEQMAARLGMSKENYIRMEANKDWPSLMKLADMAAILNVSVDFLLSGAFDKQHRQSGHLMETPKGHVCTEEFCEWRQDGYCPGAGCMKATAHLT